MGKKPRPGTNGKGKNGGTTKTSGPPIIYPS